MRTAGTATGGAGASKIRGAIAALWLALAVPLAAQAQTPEPWRAVVGGDTLWIGGATAELAAASLLARLAARGRPLARVDSADGGTRRLHVTPGPALPLGALRLEGADGLGELAAGWKTAVGAPLDAEALAADLDAALAALAARGWTRARLSPTATLAPDGSSVELRVAVDRGPRAALGRVELVDPDGRARRGTAFAARVVGAAPGTPFLGLDVPAARRELLATGLYRSVGEPTLAEDGQGRVVVRVPVEAGPPGVFDLVLGYLPPAAGRDGGVVGSGRLELRDVFGGGRLLRAALDRTPGLASSLDLAASDPYFAGLPLRVSAAFEGTSRDSTFSRQTFGGAVGYRIGPGLELSLSARLDGVSPGRAGAQPLPGDIRPRVRRSSALFAGAGLAFRRLDALAAPRRGLAAEVTVESGVRRRDALPGDTLSASRSERQQRLTSSVRGFLPVLRRQTLALGIDADVLLGGRSAGALTDGEAAFDEGELARLGGASSLRGYDEDEFLGAVVGRALAELRTSLGGDAFAFAFVDLGFVDRPAVPGLVALRRVLPGYGAGAQLQTGLGLATVTYALNPDLPLGRGKVHIGLSVGL